MYTFGRNTMEDLGKYTRRTDRKNETGYERG